MKEFATLIRKYDRVHLTIVGIRSKVNETFQRENPDLQIFMHDAAVYRILAGYFLGFLPFMNLKGSSVQVPVYSEEFVDWVKLRFDKSEQWKVTLAGQALRLMNFLGKPLIWHLKQRGIITFAWVCNT